MNKDYLINLLKINNEKTLLILLYRICSDELNDNSLSKLVILNDARYNSYQDLKNTGQIPLTSNEEINQIRNSIIEIIEKLPNREFKTRLPTSNNAAKELLTRLSNKRKIKYNLSIILLIAFGLTSCLLAFFLWEDIEPIDELEKNFNSLFISERSVASRNKDAKIFSPYEGLWKIDLDSVGYVKNTCYNVLEDIGSLPDSKRLVFYPISGLMRISAVEMNPESKVQQFRAVEFVKVAILEYETNKIIKKLTDKDIQENKLADLGIIFFNQLEINGNTQKRQLFSISHQIVHRTDDKVKEEAVDRALSNLTSIKYRSCPNISKIQKLDRKTIISFSNCNYDSNKYVRVLRKIE